MKKGMKMLSLVLVAGLSASILSGCSLFMNTQKVVDKMFEEQPESATNEMEFDVGISYASQGMSMEFAVSGDAEAEVVKDGEDTMTHSIVNAKLTIPEMLTSMIGQDIPKYSTELYTTGDDKEQTVYMYDSEDKEWRMTTAEVGKGIDEAKLEEVQDALKQVLYKAELQKKSEKVGGEDCYVLKLNTTGDEFEDVLDVLLTIEDENGKSIKDAIEDSGDVTVKDIKSMMQYVEVDATIYASKKKGYCVSYEVDLSATDLAAMVKKGMDIAGVSEDDLGGMFSPDGLSFTSFYFRNTVSNINDTEVEIPDTVKDEAVDTGAMTGTALPGSGDDDGWDDGGDVVIDDGDGFDDGSSGTTTTNTDLDINTDGSVNFAYEGGVITLYPYADYELNMTYSDSYSLYYENDNWASYYVSKYAPYDFKHYVDDESYVPDGYSDYSVEYDLYNDSTMINGSYVLVGIEEKVDSDGWQYKYAYILIPYEDSWGDEEALTISFSSSDVDNWTLTDVKKAASEILAYYK